MTSLYVRNLRLVRFGLLVLSVGFILLLRASTALAGTAPTAGGFYVDASDAVTLLTVSQSTPDETTITYAASSLLAVSVNTYKEGDYAFGVGIPTDATDVQFGVDHTDIECAGGSGRLSCVAHYKCIVVILVPTCFAISSTASVSYKRTITLKQASVNVAGMATAGVGTLAAINFPYQNTKYGGSGQYDVDINWIGLNQPDQPPLAVEAVNPNTYVATVGPTSVHITAGTTDAFGATIRLVQPRNPLLFIPGITGSKLVAGKELWPPPHYVVNTWDDLSLDPAQTHPPITAPDITYEIFGYPVYKPILQTLQNVGGYVLYDVNNSPERRTTSGCDESQKVKKPSLFTFAYDWRKSNVENAPLLADYVGCIRKFYPDQPIDILAHSMGGLLARRYLVDHPTELIGRVVTVGSPWWGTPKAIAALETGEFLGNMEAFGLGLYSSDVKKLVRFFPAFHELLPSPAYFSAGQPFVEKGWDINGNGKADEVYSYADLQNLLDSRYPTVGNISAPMQQNKLFHSPSQDFQQENSSLEYLHIYGNGGRKTIIQVQASAYLTCQPDTMFCTEMNFFRNILSSGDDTVALPSSSRGNESGASAKIKFRQITQGETDHTKMLGNPTVQKEILNFLLRKDKQQNTTQAAQTTPTTALATSPDYLIQLLNVQTPQLTDALGNHYTFDQDYEGTALISMTHYYLGNASHQFIVPADQPYTLTFQVNTAPSSLEIVKREDQANTQALRYNDLTFPTQRTIILKLPVDQNALQQDSNGDGVPDTVLTPQAVVDGALANDTEAPNVTIQAQPSGALQQITLTAQDAQAGVKALYYATDGNHYQPYTAPFTVNPTQVNVVSAFAEDKVANRSAAQRLVLAGNGQPNAPRFYLPFIAHGVAVNTPTPTPQPTATPRPAATPTPVTTPAATPPRPSLLDPSFGNNGRVITSLGHSFGVELTSLVARQTDGKLIGGNGHTLFRVTPQGALDETFGDNGFVTVLPILHTLAVQADDKIVVGGALKEEGLETISDFVVARYTAAGRLDASFADNGVLRIKHQRATFVWAEQVVPQPDGKLLVLGRLPSQPDAIFSTPVLLRLLPNGALDETFAGTGLVFFKDPAYPNMVIFKLALQPDGKIIVAGDPRASAETAQAVLFRLQSDGTPDATFGNGGVLLTDFGDQLSSINGITFQPDGKIVLAVSASYGASANLAIVRLLTNGALDTSFAATGRAVLDLQDPSGEATTGVALLPDGKILASGTMNTGSDPVVVRFTGAGALDATFGDNGKVLLNPAGDHRLQLSTLLLQPDGKVVLTGVTNRWQNGPRELTLLRLDPAGARDATFASTGEAHFSPGNSVGQTLALQPDGKLLVGGYTGYRWNNTQTDWTLLRYTSNGALDPSFNGSGAIITSFREGHGNTGVQALALQPDGKIVAAGAIYFPQTGNDGPGVARYNPDGTLDTTFAEQGKLSAALPLALAQTTHALVLQPDGKIIVGGKRTEGNKGIFALVRLTTAGAFDPTFAGDGQVNTTFTGQAELRALALQTDGKIIAVGTATDPQTFSDSFVVVRYNSDGTLDPSFDGDGMVFTTFAQTQGAYAVAVQNDGKILVGGAADGELNDSNTDFALLRYQPNGALDTTFDGDGKVFTPFAAYSLEGIADLAIQPDGKIVAGGYTTDQYNRDFALVRYQANGAVDKTFACGANVQTDLGAPGDQLNALALQPDGKIVAVGYTYYTVAVVRYLANGVCN